MGTTTDIRPILTDDDLARTQAAIKCLVERSLGDVEQAELNALMTLSDEYERKRFPRHDRDGVDAIAGAIEHAGQDKEDLVRLWGSRDAYYEVMNRKRPLTLEMIRAVSDLWGLPIAMLTRSRGRLRDKD